MIQSSIRNFCLSILVCCHAFGIAQELTVGTLAYNPTLFSEGYTLVYPHNQPNVQLLNGCGEIVHQWTNDSTARPGNSAYLAPMGNLILTHRPADFSNDAIWAGGGGATIEARSWNNESIWEFTLNDSTARLHHDIAMMNNGHILAIAWDRIDSAEAIASGRNPSLLDGGELWSEKIIEIAPSEMGQAEIVWEWRVWNHLVQSFDSTKANFGNVGDAPHLIDLNFGNPNPVAPDWLHINSIDYHPGTGHILLSVPSFHELWIVDRNDGESGLKWRWGNAQAYDHGIDEDQMLFFQHSAHWLDAPYLASSEDFGKIAVFNNRNPGPSGPFSSAHLIANTWNPMDSSYAWVDEAYGPIGFDWTWTAPNPTDFFSSGLSNFERLANGNNLVTSGRTGEIFEFTSTGDTAWHYTVPLQGGVPVEQGTELGVNANIIFRANRYPAQYPAFNNFEFNPVGFWEINPQPLQACVPCALDISVTFDNNLAYAMVTGNNGAWTTSWYAGDQFICNGDTLNANDSENIDCYESIQNLLNDGTMLTVVVSDESGCEAEATGIWLATGVNERLSSWRVYPNPTNGRLVIEGANAPSHAALYDQLGKLAWDLSSQNWQGTTSLQMDHLNPGWYVLVLDTTRLPIVLIAD